MSLPPLLPGATIGLLGGGQLGRMLILAGRAMGYRFHVFEPCGPSPAGMIADNEINAEYSNEAALIKFAQQVDLITLEFENIPATAIQTIAAVCPAFPSAEVLHICQHRQREKDFLRAADLPHAPFDYAQSAISLSKVVQRIGFPCVIKTAAFGYDGKGQIKLSQPEDAADPVALWNQLGEPAQVVVEKWIEHKGEFSVICARRADGICKTFPVSENCHRNHILHTSVAPAQLSPQLIKSAETLAKAVAETLDVVGLITVELFLAPEGHLLVNEMAPRPHNSGHYTIEGCHTSQFEQQLRAVCGLPLGSTDLRQPTVMVNLLGDLWEHGTPDWSILLQEPGVHLHLYDKGSPRPGRKMGHFTVMDSTAALATARAENLFQTLSSCKASD